MHQKFEELEKREEAVLADMQEVNSLKRKLVVAEGETKRIRRRLSELTAVPHGQELIGRMEGKGFGGCSFSFMR